MEDINVVVDVLDSICISGGVVNSRVAIGVGDYNNELTIDFASINIYGVGIYDKNIIKIKSQSTLGFPFLNDERLNLSSHQDLFLIFSSDPYVFCIGKNLGVNDNEIKFVHNCTIPPFIPPSFKGKYMTFGYYVYINVQYRGSVSNKLSVSCKKVELNILGSIYSDIPILDVKYYPILPKVSNSKGKMDELASDLILNNFNYDCMFFNYKSNVINLDDVGRKDEVIYDGNERYDYLVCDLNVIWAIYDCINTLKHRKHDTAIDVSHYFNSIVNDFSRIINGFLDSPCDNPLRLDRFRFWFGEALSEDIYTAGGSGCSKPSRSELMNRILNELKRLTSTLYNVDFDDLKDIKKRIDASGGRDEDEVDSGNCNINNNELINFSYCGNSLCTCNIKGLNNNGEIMVNNQVNILFNFIEHNHKCICVDVNVHFMEEVSAFINKALLSSHRLDTLGKISCTLNITIPHDTTPTVCTPIGNISHEIEVIFYCLHNQINIMDHHLFKNELNKLKMIKWSKVIKILQNDSLRLHVRNIIHDKVATDNIKLYYNRRIKCIEL